MDTEITDIEEKIASIKQELVDLRKSYIKEHAIYQLGEDVVIRDVKGKIVDILMVDVWDNLEPSFSYFWSRYKQD